MNQYRTAVQYAYEQLKSWILDHTLKPDQRLDQDELATMLNLSKTPVRTALEKLASEGLVQVSPHRSASISPLSREELEEIYMLREMLEAKATRLAVQRITPEELVRVRELMDRSEQLIAQGKFAEYLEVNRQFHLTIYRAAKSSVLYRLIALLWDMSLRYRAAYLQLPGRTEDSIAEHREIVRLLAAGEEEKVVPYMTLHNNKTKQVLLSLMASGDID